MKGIVFALKKRKEKPSKKSSNLYYRTDFKYLFRRYGAVAFFTLMLISGLTAGAIAFNSFDKEILAKLDFLFLTNLPERLEDGMAGVFCASFASDFLFLLTAFFMGLSLWGVAVLPILTFFKGFGIGISAGYLFSTYSLTGVLFYITILLPGIFVFSMALVYQSVNSYSLTVKIYKVLFLSDGYTLRAPLKIFVQKSFVYLICSLLASVLDMCLWCAFAGLFKF